MELVDQCIAYHKDHFFIHGISENLSKLKVQNYRYRGYSAFVNSVTSYYRQNINLLDKDIYYNLFHQKNFIKTKVSNTPPVHYKTGANVKKSIVGNGCVIDGDVEHSILFRGVHVGKGAVIKNSIIMQRTSIGEDVYLENVIIDKDVKITKGQKLIGCQEKPYVVAKRQTI